MLRRRQFALRGVVAATPAGGRCSASTGGQMCPDCGQAPSSPGTPRCRMRGSRAPRARGSACLRRRRLANASAPVGSRLTPVSGKAGQRRRCRGPCGGHADRPGPATSDIAKGSRPTGRQPETESQLAGRSGPTPAHRTSPTSRIRTRAPVRSAASKPTSFRLRRRGRAAQVCVVQRDRLQLVHRLRVGEEPDHSEQTHASCGRALSQEVARSPRALSIT